MNAVLEDNRKYRAYLCSRVPNNECFLCSHYLPEHIGQTKPIKHPLAFGYHSYDKCPSCKRAVTRIFVSEEMSPPERVPNDLPFRVPEEILYSYFSVEKVLRMTVEEKTSFLSNSKPSQFREDLDWEERNRKLKEFLQASSSGDSKKVSKLPFEEPYKLPEKMGRRVRKKIRF